MKLRHACIPLVAAALLAACSGDDDTGSFEESDVTGVTIDESGGEGCVTVDMAVSSEKITLLTELANSFNDSAEAEVAGGDCIFVRPKVKASGGAAQLLVDGWPNPEANGPQPVIWSPAASGWGAIVNQRLTDKGEAPIVGDSQPFMLTPLVIAMPKPMAEALGYPATPVGFRDIVELANNPEGWAAVGHPEWGQFRLGKTNPNFSTSGLNFTIAEYYAATGKTSGLTSEDLRRPEVGEFAQSVENAVVHYGDTTLTFLNNWARADARGTALTYASAVAVEEKSVLDYNAGNPDGILDAGEVPRPPRDPLVAIYPEEGTLFSDNPLFVLDAAWVSPEQKEAAAKFSDFVTRPENQAKVLEFNFRPGNPQVPVGPPIVTENGVNPDEPQTLLEVPRPDVMVSILDTWAEQRKGARVLLVVDVSGSMGEPAGSSGETKLDLAKQAAIRALDQFQDHDEVGLRIFSTDITSDPSVFYVDPVPIAAMEEGQRSQLATSIENLIPMQGTPLYDVTADSYQDMLEAFAPDKINAIVVLSDGVNDDGDSGDDAAQLDGLIADLRAGTEGGATKPVRIFPIAYGREADLATLRRIGEATNAAVYSSSDPTTIDQVFTQVVSNF